MKKLLSAFMILFMACLFMVPQSIEAAKEKPIIKADKQSFDPSRGVYSLKGNVYVYASGRSVTANEATFDPASLQVWADGNVTFKQDGMIITGDTLRVYVSKKTAILSGNIMFKNATLAISATEGEYNWKSKVATFKNNVVVKDDSGEPDYFSDFSYNVISGEVVASS